MRLPNQSPPPRTALNNGIRKNVSNNNTETKRSAKDTSKDTNSSDSGTNSNADTWGNRFAKKQTTAEQIIEKPSALDAVQRSRSNGASIGDTSSLSGIRTLQGEPTTAPPPAAAQAVDTSSLEGILALQNNKPVQPPVDTSSLEGVLALQGEKLDEPPVAIPATTRSGVDTSTLEGVLAASESDDQPAEGTPEAVGEQLAAEGRSSSEVDKILEDFDTLQNGSESEQVQAAFSLAQNLQPEKITELTKELGIDDQPVVKLLTDKKAIGAVATLVSTDPSVSTTDKLVAAVNLVEATGGLATGSLEQALKKPLAAISAGPELLKAIETFRDPDASALDKSKAALSFAAAAKDSLSELSDAFKNKAGRLDSLNNSLSAALTILDPDASNQDRAKAVADLFSNVPDVKNDLGVLQKQLVDEVLSEYGDVAFDLPAGVVDSLDPAVRDSLTPEQVSRINKLSDELVDGTDNAVADVLAKVSDPKSVDALLDAVEGQSDKAGKKALLETLEGLRPSTFDDVLQSSVDGKNGAAALGDLVSKLDPDSRAALKKIAGGLDGDALSFLVRTGDAVDPKVAGELLQVAQSLPSHRIGQVLNFFDSGLAKAGVKVTPDILEKLAKNLTKLIPGIGAVPALYDAGRLGLIAADTKLPDDIRFLAATGAKINVLDAGASIVEAFTAWTGVSVAADVAIGVGALFVDLVVADQTSKFKEAQAAGVEYDAPDALTTFNVASAAAQGPAGWVEFWGIYGADDGIAALGTAATVGGTAAIDAAEGLLTLGAEGIGESLELTADGLHLLADIIRNPGEYGDRAAELGKQAVERLNDLAEGASDLAEAAAKELGEAVNDLKELGEDGLEALSWIASNPGKAAEIATDAIGEVASEALELGTAAGRAVAQKALETLDTLADLGGKAAEAATKAFNDITDRAVALGEQGIETLGWIASNPGESAEIAKQALVDVAAAGGELAKAAYGEIVNLGEAGIELANDVANKLVDLGEEGIETLAFIATHPGEAAQIAVDGLQNLASQVGDAATRAGEALVDLAEGGYDTAKEAVQTLLLEGGEAFQNVVVALGENIGPGLKSIVNGLADLGDAGLEALTGLADAGFNFAADGFGYAADKISDLGNWAWNNTGGRILDFFR